MSCVSKILILIAINIYVSEVCAQKYFSQRKLRKLFFRGENICADKNKIEFEKIFFASFRDTVAPNYSCAQLRKLDLIAKTKSENEVGLFLLVLPQHHMNEPHLVVWRNKEKFSAVKYFNEAELNIILIDVTSNKTLFKKNYARKIKRIFKKCKK